MSAPMTISECVTCGYLAYPPRILCPNCGGSEWKRRLAGSGVVTEVTVRRPVFNEEAMPLAAVRSEDGVRIVARVPEGTEVGDRVELVQEGSIAIARPDHHAQA
jgi:uncharacterized OB-fold protein